MKLNVFIIIFFLGITLNVKPQIYQTRNYDKTEAKNSTSGNLKIKNLYSKVENAVSKNQLDSALFFIKIGLLETENGKFKHYKSKFLILKGDILKLQTKYTNALKHYFQALEIYDKSNFVEEKSVCLENIASTYLIQDNYAKASEYFFKLLKFYDDNGAKNKKSIALGGIGSVFFGLGNYDKALFYSNLALKNAKKHNNKRQEYINLCNVGNVYARRGNLTKTIEYHLNSLEILEELGDKRNQIILLSNIGTNYREQKLFSQAKSYYQKALKLSIELDDFRGKSLVLEHLGSFYLNRKEYYNCEKTLKELEFISRKHNLRLRLQNACSLLSTLYEQLQRPNLALVYFKEFTTIRDSIQSEFDFRTSVEQELHYEFEKQNAIDSIAKSKEIKIKETEIALHKAELNSKKSQLYLLFAGIAFLVGFGVIIYKRYKTTKNQKRKIEEEKLEIENKKLIIENNLNKALLRNQISFFKGQEEEKRKTAQILHDNIGSSITLLSYQLEKINNSNYSESMNSANKELSVLSKQIRNLSHELLPISLKEHGIVAGLKELFQRVDGDINVHFSEIELNELSPEKSLQVYRIFQELLKNTISHAEAKNIYIQFHREKNKTTIMYEDDGLGFNMENIQKGLGLNNIQTRCDLIGAEWRIETSPNNGFTAYIDLFD